MSWAQYKANSLSFGACRHRCLAKFPPHMEVRVATSQGCSEGQVGQWSAPGGGVEHLLGDEGSRAGKPGSLKHLNPPPIVPFERPP